MNAAGPGASVVAWPDDALEVGRIAGAWGVKGWFRIVPYASEANALLAARRWHLRPPLERPLLESAATDHSAARVLAIVASRRHGDAIIASAQGIGDRGGAEALRGATVHISRADFPAVGNDEYYWADLVGLTVANREGQAFGIVSGLIDTGPHSVLRVHDDATGEEWLIPFVAAYVDSVDLESRRIAVDWQADF